MLYYKPMVYIKVYKVQILRTKTGYQLGSLHVASKPNSKLPTQQARTLLYVAQGLSQKRIALEMGVKPSTVKKACSDLSYRFRSRSMRETVFIAMKEGVLRYALCIFLCLGGSLNTDIQCVSRITRTARVARVVRARELYTEVSTY